MNPNEPKRPIVLEKIQLESRKVFSVNNRKAVLDERKNDRKLFSNGSINENSFFVKRQKLISELPPHPKKILLPLIENQLTFLGGIVLSLTHKSMMTHFGKSMIDFVILRSIFGVGLLFYLFFEIYDIKEKMNMLVAAKRSMIDLNSLDSMNYGGSFFTHLSYNSKVSLFIWMFISSILTISQPLIDKFFPIQMISLSQPFAPLTSLIIFFLLTYKINKEYYFWESSNNKTAYSRLCCSNGQSNEPNKNKNSSSILEITQIIDSIKLEMEKLFQRSRMITDNQISFTNISIIILSFISLFSATPIKGVIAHLAKTTNSLLLCGMIPILILPALHDVLFHLVCNKILKELMTDQIVSNQQLNIDFTRISPINDLRRKLCNIYIHSFMTLGQVLIVLPVCLGIKVLFYNKFSSIDSTTENNEYSLSLIWHTIESMFNIEKKEFFAVIFSVVSMLGIYQRCKINNVETFGLTGLIVVQGFQTLLSTSIKSTWPVWIRNNFLGLILSISSILIMKIQDIIGTIKIFYLYTKWALYFNSEAVNYSDVDICEYKHTKSYKSNIRVIGGTIDIKQSASGPDINDNTTYFSNEALLYDEVSLKSDTESENNSSKYIGYNMNKLTNAIHSDNSKNNSIATNIISKKIKNSYIEPPIMSAKVVVLQN
ncbi:transmembrane domain-containing protein [Cryptosporidium canis]|uniref:Transmembrane domain-containing protein n=1 Tax=Cryptosporidium canis TaxID=195482 RepID=A0A9D5DH99_9CRYT|nr:transmembrane domain-containing protein [Cryptosporidium canis]